MLNLEKAHWVDHLVVNDISQIDIWLCNYTILNIYLQKGVGDFDNVLNILIYINCSNMGRAI